MEKSNNSKVAYVTQHRSQLSQRNNDSSTPFLLILHNHQSNESTQIIKILS